MEVGRSSKKWKREVEKREERTKDDLCSGIHSEQRREIGKSTLTLHQLERLPSRG